MPGRERFLTELTLDPPSAAGGPAGPPHKDEDYLILSTIHSAKGQEWKAVFVLNLVDGCIPSDMATDRPENVEEERRLLYVAMPAPATVSTCSSPSASTSPASPATATGMYAHLAAASCPTASCSISSTWPWVPGAASTGRRGRRCRLSTSRRRSSACGIERPTMRKGRPLPERPS